MVKKFNPCPFCKTAKEVVLVDWGPTAFDGARYQVECQACGTAGPRSIDDRWVVGKWDDMSFAYFEYLHPGEKNPEMKGPGDYLATNRASLDALQDSEERLNKDDSPVVIVVPMTEEGVLVTVFLTDKGICGEVTTSLTAEKARGAHVVFYGSSPNLLALTSAAKVTEVLFDRPEGGWRKDLTLKELDVVFRGFRSYRVTRL